MDVLTEVYQGNIKIAVYRVETIQHKAKFFGKKTALVKMLAAQFEPLKRNVIRCYYAYASVAILFVCCCFFNK